MEHKYSSTWNLIFPGEEEQRRKIFNKINRVPLADFDWFVLARKYNSGRSGKIMSKINFHLMGKDDEGSPLFRLINLMDSKWFNSCCLPFGGTKKSPLSKFLEESKNDKFKVFVECPTGLVMEGEFSCGASLYTLIKDSSKIYLSGYETSFNLTKQGDVVPDFSEFYFEKVSLYDVMGTKTLVICPKVDRDVKKIHSQHGKSVSLFSIKPEETTRTSENLEDLYEDL